MRPFPCPGREWKGLVRDSDCGLGVTAGDDSERLRRKGRGEGLTTDIDMRGRLWEGTVRNWAFQVKARKHLRCKPESPTRLLSQFRRTNFLFCYSYRTGHPTNHGIQIHVSRSSPQGSQHHVSIEVSEKEAGVTATQEIQGSQKGPTPRNPWSFQINRLYVDSRLPIALYYEHKNQHNLSQGLVRMKKAPSLTQSYRSS